jgi:hypothetical protein
MIAYMPNGGMYALPTPPDRVRHTLNDGFSLSLGVERVPHLWLDTGGASATDGKVSPEGATYHSPANGLGPRIPSFLCRKP